jgi:hypothetical protein
MNSYEVFTNVPVGGDSLLLNSGRSIPGSRAIPVHSVYENKSLPTPLIEPIASHYTG